MFAGGLGVAAGGAHGCAKARQRPSRTQRPRADFPDVDSRTGPTWTPKLLSTAKIC